MKAIIMFDYRLGAWLVHGVVTGLYIDQDRYIWARLTDEGRYRYPSVVMVDCDNAAFDGEKWDVNLSEGVELPEVVTLEKSIENNRTKLRAMLQCAPFASRARSN